MMNILTSVPVRLGWRKMGSGHEIGEASAFWLGLWPALMALAWLLPNHYIPWRTFHADAWMGAVLGMAFVATVSQYSWPKDWHWTIWVIGALAALPISQHFAGMLPYAGQAWISMLYLLGLMAAMLIGARSEAARSEELANAVFLAVGIASLVSVGLQFHQWLQLDGLEVWSMGHVKTRPHANLGQPNQLSTLLLWGLLACAWGVIVNKIRPSVAILLACFLLFGVALTQSRTAWLGLGIIIAATWGWRKLLPFRYMPWVVTGLGIYLALCVVTIQSLGDMDYLVAVAPLEDRANNEMRLFAWRLFIDAALQKPWFGYGLTDVLPAQLAVALDHPALGIRFAQSHNIFLDLILWCGIPIGLLISGCWLYWLLACIRRVASAQNAVLVTFLLVIGNHAMLEFPLHFAYFLLPAGLVIGVLNARFALGPTIHVRWQAPALLFLLSIALYAAVVHDYFKVEQNYYALRFERARIGTLPIAEPPDVLVLTQLREQLKLARIQVIRGATEQELDWMRNIAIMTAGPAELYFVATTYALNQREREGRIWLDKLCKITSEKNCAMAKRVWAGETGLKP